MQLNDKQRAAIVAWATKTPEVHEVMLFGSRCKGEAEPNSDVDLALVMEGFDRDEQIENYLADWDIWEEELTATLGLTVYLGLFDPALGPEAPAAVAECRIDLWQRGV